MSEPTSQQENSDAPISDRAPFVGCSWCGQDASKGYHGWVSHPEAMACKHDVHGPGLSLCPECDGKREDSWTRSKMMTALDLIAGALDIPRVVPWHRANLAIAQILATRDALKDATREVANLRRWNQDEERRRANERGILCDEIAARQQAEARAARLQRELDGFRPLQFLLRNDGRDIVEQCVARIRELERERAGEVSTNKLQMEENFRLRRELDEARAILRDAWPYLEEGDHGLATPNYQSIIDRVRLYGTIHNPEAQA